MELNKPYLDNLRTLVSSLGAAKHPENWRIFAIIMALVHEIQSTLNIEECIKARAHSRCLDNLLSECRVSVSSTSSDSILHAAHCLKILEAA